MAEFTPLNILIAIFGVSLLVIVHETGHYLAARAFGMRVLRYSIGFGTVLWKWQPKGSPTIFQVCAVPFLAYVQIDGMNPMEPADPKDPELFSNKSVMARIVTIAGGPAANYLFASVATFAALLALGQAVPVPGPPVVSSVADGTPAAEAGLQAGDVIVEANGKHVAGMSKLIGITAPRAGLPTRYRVRRGDDTLELTITPIETPDAPGIGRIGIRMAAPETRHESIALEAAFRTAVWVPIQLSKQSVLQIGAMVRQGTTQGLAGPVRMTQEVARSVAMGPERLISILVMISVALGFFNLLPFPALDGGRLVFLVYEVVTRRKANDKVEAAIHTVGLLFLLGMLVLVTFRDVGTAIGSGDEDAGGAPASEAAGASEDGDAARGGDDGAAEAAEGGGGDGE